LSVQTALRIALAASFAVIGLWRLLYAIVMLGAPDHVPAAAAFAVTGQAVTAFIAAACLAWNARAIGRSALVGFAVFVAFQMGVDALLYGIRAALEAVIGIALGVTLAVLGWIALSPDGAEPRPASCTPQPNSHGARVEAMRRRRT
jgi:hypothetical protein